MSSEDKITDAKYVKQAVSKCVELLVEGRRGRRINTFCNPKEEDNNWFFFPPKQLPNVDIDHIYPGGGMQIGQSICIEFILKTVDYNETLVLETWSFSLCRQAQQRAKRNFTLYQQIAIMLKSLTSVSRVVPAYNVSRKQGPETYSLAYKMYLGPAEVEHLGEGHITKRVGRAHTTVGTLQVHVHYRVKIVLPSQSPMRVASMPVKDDHFTTEMCKHASRNSPHCKYTTVPCYNYENYRSPPSEDVFASNDVGTVFSTSPADGLSAPAYSVSNHPKYYSDYPPSKQPTNERGQTEDHHTNEDDLFSNSPLLPCVGAFASLNLDALPSCINKDSCDDLPFINLLQHSDTTTTTTESGSSGAAKFSEGESSDAHLDSTTMRNTGSSSGLNKSTHSDKSENDDYVIVSLKTPFATGDSDSELTRFYKECQGAPSLSMFRESLSVEDTLNNITEQLSVFEANTGDFDTFVQSLDSGEGSD